MNWNSGLYCKNTGLKIKEKQREISDIPPPIDLLNILWYNIKVKCLDAAINCSALHYFPVTGYWSQLNQGTASHEPLIWASL